MLKEEFEMSYEEFIKKYVKEPIYDYCISFKFKGMLYQFDYPEPPAPTNIPGKTPYDFIKYEGEWEKELFRISYKNLMEAIEKCRIDGLTFEEVFNHEDSELIDIS